VLISQPHSNQCSSIGESMKITPFKYSVARLSANTEHELIVDPIGLKADWDTISWGPIRILAEELAQLGMAVIQLDGCEFRAEAYEQIKNDVVGYGYDVVVISAEEILGETLGRIGVACLTFVESIFNDGDISSQRLNFRPSLKEDDAKVVFESSTDFLSAVGRHSITVPHTITIGDECISSPPRYANKPQIEEISSEFLELTGRFVGAELIEKVDRRSGKKVIRATCKLVQYISAEPLLLHFAPEKFLSHVHSRLFDGIDYCLNVRKDFGCDGKPTYFLCDIGQPSVYSPARVLP
jgi:hypothetical protein